MHRWFQFIDTISPILSRFEEGTGIVSQETEVDQTPCSFKPPEVPDMTLRSSVKMMSCVLACFEFFFVCLKFEFFGGGFFFSKLRLTRCIQGSVIYSIISSERQNYGKIQL